VSQRQIEVKINAAITKIVEDIYSLSQKKVPVQTGQLKASGSFRAEKTGGRIIYSAPYASVVEFGSTGTGSTGSYVSKIKKHVRTTPSGKKVKVNAHTKTYSSGKPTRFGDGNWRIVNPNQSFTGRKFLTSSVQEILAKAFARQNGLQAYIR